MCFESVCACAIAPSHSELMLGQKMWKIVTSYLAWSGNNNKVSKLAIKINIAEKNVKYTKMYETFILV